MLKQYDKYFWDGKTGWSDGFIFRRIIEYASFEDLIQYPFSEVKLNIDTFQLEKLRTGQKRKDFMMFLKQYIHSSNSWEEAIQKMLAPSFENIHKLFDYETKTEIEES